jgi:hypothetical protein
MVKVMKEIDWREKHKQEVMEELQRFGGLVGRTITAVSVPEDPDEDGIILTLDDGSRLEVGYNVCEGRTNLIAPTGVKPTAVVDPLESYDHHIGD